MPETCKSCGAQLFTGARFCRSCGAQLAPLISEDLPTQVMPGSQGADTSQVGPQTQNIFTPPPPYYQQQVPAYQYPVPKSRSPWGWIITFVAMGVFGLVILVALFAARSRSSDRRRTVPETTITVTPSPPPAARKAFELNPDASVIINGGIGDVSLEGWDQSYAEIASDRGDERSLRGMKIDFSQDREVLSIGADGPGPFGRMPMNIKVKVPRELARISVHIKTGNISLSDMTSAIDVVLDHGDVELRNISGSVTTKVGNGNTRVGLKNFSEEAPLSFTTGKGNVNLKFDSELNADLDAETGVGNINIDRDFPVTIERRLVSQKAFGRIGEGGQSLKIKVGLGNIEIAK